MTLSQWRLVAVALAMCLLGLLLFARFARSSPLAPTEPTAKERRLEHLYDAFENVTDEIKRRR